LELQRRLLLVRDFLEMEEAENRFKDLYVDNDGIFFMSIK
jgi:hypothetical protein